MPERDARAQQRAFDHFRHEDNDQRPHEALGLKPPARAYAPSSRRYPRKLVRFEDHDAFATLRVDRDGFVRWDKRRVLISSALAHEDVLVDPDDDRWEVR